jgi:hypothetical protein
LGVEIVTGTQAVALRLPPEPEVDFKSVGIKIKHCHHLKEGVKIYLLMCNNISS